jgi:hypothetical protein
VAGFVAGELVDKGSWRSSVQGRRLNSKKLKYIDSTRRRRLEHGCQ